MHKDYQSPESVDCSKPVLLDPANFTPLTRTPWAGFDIASRYKSKLVPSAVGQKIGESWEFSCDPAFPSKLLGSTTTLPALISAKKDAVLGPRESSCEILVKLLNADQPLSVQVHPEDQDKDLKPNECGKPESWYVLAAEEGAGLYLGFSRAMSKEELRQGLLTGGKGKELLQFVPVKAGDYFEIEPGVPHCIGPGVTLLEPQRIILGKSGKTYRLWDFDRTYDANGIVDLKHGKPRELHIEAGLKLVDPMKQNGLAWVNTLRRQAKHEVIADGVTLELFPANQWYRTLIVHAAAGSSFDLPIKGGYASLTVLEGSLKVADVTLPFGQTALLPAESLPAACIAEKQCLLAVVCPASCEMGV